tara:strand:- start:75 stop:437 length:363 start_codon:yes stop_codon:yes gene_type:complete
MKKLLKEIIKEILIEDSVSLPVETPTCHPLLGTLVLIRARKAGVHYGILARVGDFVILTNSHRIWKWEGAFTLSEVSQKGITKGRVACLVQSLSIPIEDVAEIINLTTDAHDTLSSNIES